MDYCPQRLNGIKIVILATKEATINTKGLQRERDEGRMIQRERN